MSKECKFADDLPQGCCVHTNENGEILFSIISQYIHGFEESDVSDDSDEIEQRQRNSSIS